MTLNSKKRVLRMRKARIRQRHEAVPDVSLERASRTGLAGPNLTDMKLCSIVARVSCVALALFFSRHRHRHYQTLTNTCTHIHSRTHTYTHTHTRTHTHAHAHEHTHARTHVHTTHTHTLSLSDTSEYPETGATLPSPQKPHPLCSSRVSAVIT